MLFRSQLGYGSRQRRIWTAESDRTSAIAEGISSDKDLTKSLLSQCGIPIPEGEVVDSPEQAWSAAQDIGLPVVVKPLDGNHGRGVSLNLNKQEDIEAAYHVAKSKGTQVIVERYVEGEEHRLLVVGDRDADTPPHMARGYFERLVNAPCRRMVVIGDGTHNLMIERQRMQLFREVQLFMSEGRP